MHGDGREALPAPTFAEGFHQSADHITIGEYHKEDIDQKQFAC